MKIKVLWIVSAAMAIGCLIAGCDTVPPSPKVATIGQPNVLTVMQDDTAEVNAALALETARTNYKYRLEVLRDFYYQAGDHDKYVATRNELKALEQAQNFTFEGLPKVVPPEKESIEGVDERLLVEYGIAAQKLSEGRRRPPGTI